MKEILKQHETWNYLCVARWAYVVILFYSRGLTPQIFFLALMQALPRTQARWLAHGTLILYTESALVFSLHLYTYWIPCEYYCMILVDTVVQICYIVKHEWYIHIQISYTEILIVPKLFIQFQYHMVAKNIKAQTNIWKPNSHGSQTLGWYQNIHARDAIPFIISATVQSRPLVWTNLSVIMARQPMTILVWIFSGKDLKSATTYLCISVALTQGQHHLPV